MIEVIAIQAPDKPKIYDVQDMYIEPEDVEFVVGALRAATFGLERKTVETDKYNNLLEPGATRVDTSHSWSRIEAYRGTARAIDIATSNSSSKNRPVHIPDAGLAYEGLMKGVHYLSQRLGVGHRVTNNLLQATLGVRNDSWLLNVLNKRARDEFVEDQYRRISLISLGPDQYEAERATRLERLPVVVPH